MQEEPKDAAKTGIQVRVGVAAPDLPAAEDRPPMQARDRQIAVNGVIEAEVAGVEGAELLHPMGGPLCPSDEGGFGEVLEQLVVLGQAQGAGEGRRLVVFLIEKGARKLSKVGHVNDPQLGAAGGQREG